MRRGMCEGCFVRRGSGCVEGMFCEGGEVVFTYQDVKKNLFRVYFLRTYVYIGGGVSLKGGLTGLRMALLRYLF